MNFSELINKHSYKQIFNKLYSKQLRYEKTKSVRDIDVEARSAWDFLLKTQPQKSKHEIHVRLCKDFQSEGFPCAELRDVKSKLFYSFNEVSWREVLGSNIVNSSSLSDEEVCSTIFWFLTMNSFDPNK